jgi:protein-tyrosine-phosphatase
MRARAPGNVTSLAAMLLVFPIRNWLKALRHAPDRAAHPFRRRKLLRDLAARKETRSVLFVCHGNICRSPYAAESFARAIAESRPDIDVKSAGFIGPNRPSPDAAIRVARTLGINLSGHRSETLTHELTEKADLIAVMDRHQVRWLQRYFDVPAERIILLGDLDPAAIATRRIKDPVDRPDEEFLASYERVERCVRALADVLSEPASEAPPARNGRHH